MWGERIAVPKLAFVPKACNRALCSACHSVSAFQFFHIPAHWAWCLPIGEKKTWISLPSAVFSYRDTLGFCQQVLEVLWYQINTVLKLSFSNTCKAFLCSARMCCAEERIRYLHYILSITYWVKHFFPLAIWWDSFEPRVIRNHFTCNDPTPCLAHCVWQRPFYKPWGYKLKVGIY